jgi:hypothetical protein
MRRPRSFAIPVLLAAFALAAIAGAALGAARAPALVPMPREIQARAGTTTLGADWAISSTDSAADEPAVRTLAEEVRACFGWRWRAAPPTRRHRVIELRALAAPHATAALFREQGYVLEVAPDRVRVEAVTAEGRFYGVQTLRQLMRAHPDAALPRLRIRDDPALRWRGISDDLVRGQVSTMEDFRAILAQLAYYKLNLYQFYIEDVPRAGSRSGATAQEDALTQRDIAELVREGRRQHVVVCPIYQTLGHDDRLHALGEQMRSDREPDEGQANPERRTAGLGERVRQAIGELAVAIGWRSEAPARLSAEDPQAIAFMAERVGALASVTRGPFFHVGGDEWAGLGGAGGADARASSRAALAYGRYLGALAASLRARYGCRVMAYSDVLLQRPEAAETLPRDVIIMDWHYDPVDSFPSLDQLERAGYRDVVVSPGLWNWNTFYPYYGRAFHNIAAFTRAGKRAGAMGSVTSSWGDNGAESLRQNNWPGYAFAAAAAWESATPEPDTFLRRFVVTQYGLDSPALARAEKLLGWQDFSSFGWAGGLFHRPPLVRSRNEPWPERMRTLERDMMQVERDLAAARGRIRFHADQLAAARHCARRYRYVAERDLVLDAAGRMLAGRTTAELPPGARAELVRALGALAATSDSLRSEYARLWLEHNRAAGLAENEQRMARQSVMLRRLEELAVAGRLGEDDSFSRMQAASASH